MKKKYKTNKKIKTIIVMEGIEKLNNTKPNKIIKKKNLSIIYNFPQF
jgi:hypothetical protein